MKNLRKKITGIIGVLVAAMLFTSCSNEIVETEVKPVDVVIEQPVIAPSLDISNSQPLEDPFLLKLLNLKLIQLAADSGDPTNSPYAAMNPKDAILSTYTTSSEASIIIPMEEEGLSLVIYSLDREFVGDEMLMKVEEGEEFSSITFYNLDREEVGNIDFRGNKSYATGIAADIAVDISEVRCSLSSPACAASLLLDITKDL